MGCGSSTSGTVEAKPRAEAEKSVRRPSVTNSTTNNELRAGQGTTETASFAVTIAAPKEVINGTLEKPDQPRLPALHYFAPDGSSPGSNTSTSPSTIVANPRKPTVVRRYSEATNRSLATGSDFLYGAPLPQTGPSPLLSHSQPIGLVSHGSDDRSVPNSVDTGATNNCQTYHPHTGSHQQAQPGNNASYVLPSATSAASLAMRANDHGGYSRYQPETRHQPETTRQHTTLLSDSSGAGHAEAGGVPSNQGGGVPITISTTITNDQHQRPEQPQQHHQNLQRTQVYHQPPHQPPPQTHMLYAPQVLGSDSANHGARLYLSPHDEVLSVHSRTTSVAPSASSNDAVAAYLRETAAENDKLRQELHQQLTVSGNASAKNLITHSLVGIGSANHFNNPNDPNSSHVLSDPVIAGARPELNFVIRPNDTSNLDKTGSQSSPSTITSQKKPHDSSEKEGAVALDATIFQSFAMVKKTAVTRNSTIFRFALQTPNTKLGLPIGQHMYLKATIDGAEVQRAYTPISSDDELGYFELLVKMINNSNPNNYYAGMTTHLDRLNVGDRILAKGPAGVFAYKGNGAFVVERKQPQIPPQVHAVLAGSTVPPALTVPPPNDTASPPSFPSIPSGMPATPHNVPPIQYFTRKVKAFGMIAGGSGITPMFQIIKAILKNPSDTTQIYLLFANQTDEDITLADEIEALRAQRPGQLHVWHTLSKEPEKNAGQWPYSIGYVDEQMLRDHMVGPVETLKSEEAESLPNQVGHAERDGANRTEPPVSTSNPALLSPEGSAMGGSGRKVDADGAFLLYSCILMCGPPALVENACKPALERIGFTADQLFVF